MHGSQHLRSQLPHLFDAGTVYTVLRTMTVHGVQLKAGDTLPTDSPLRQDPTRLEVLCRTRQMVVTQVSGQEDTEGNRAFFNSPETVDALQALRHGESETETVSTVDLSQLTGPQLVRECKDRGLPAWGNKDVLRQRLRKAMG